jgi:hypothetical protein
MELACVLPILIFAGRFDNKWFAHSVVATVYILHSIRGVDGLVPASLSFSENVSVDCCGTAYHMQIVSPESPLEPSLEESSNDVSTEKPPDIHSTGLIFALQPTVIVIDCEEATEHPGALRIQH